MRDISDNPTNQELARHGQGRLLVAICGYDKLFTIAHKLPGQTCYSFARENGTLSRSTAEPLDPMTRQRQRSFHPEVFLTKMGAKTIIVLFREGQAICSQDDAGKEVFYIEKGQVKLTVKSKRGKETVLAILHRGDYLGAGCMTGQTFRTATATALTRCRVLVIEKKEMMRALHNGHEFSDHFIACLLGRNIRVEEDLIDQHLCSCEERLARALLLIARYDKIRKPTAVIPKISQKTLGGLIRSTRSRVSYFMNKFKKQGYIEYGKGLRVHSSSLAGVLQDSMFSELRASRSS